MPTTSVEIPEVLKKRIEKKVENGEYTSNSDFIRYAVRRLLDERDKIENKKLSIEAQKQISKARKTEEEYSPEELKEITK